MFTFYRHRHRATVCGLLFYLFAAACESSSKPSSQDTGVVGDASTIGETSTQPSDAAVTESCVGECPSCQTGLASQLFSWPTVPTFDITLPEDRWTYLQKHALEEEFVSACIRFEGTPVGEVGLRFKGSYGTLLPCIDDQGNLKCEKLSMKVKFSEIDKDQRFYGLKRLNFHSMVNDPTKVHELLAYDLFREMGIVSPRSAWATVTVNGKSYGLFSMVEQIDGRFVEERWPDEPDGDLYKEAWPGSSTALGYFESRLETAAEDASLDAFVRFASAIAIAKPDELGAELAKWMDPKHLARYMAVDDAIFDADGITAYYVAEDTSWSGNHNFYIYKEKSRDFFWMIPWDMDATFRVWPSFGRIPRWDVVPEDCSKRYPVWEEGTNRVLGPGCDRFFQAIATYKEAYLQAIDELLSGPFAEKKVLDRIDAYSAFITGAVEAEEATGIGKGVAAWQGELAHLRTEIPKLRQRLERLRRGQSVAPFSIEASIVNGFEEADDFGLSVGTTVYTNPGTTVSVSVTRDYALKESRSVRIDFEYRDDGKAWDQWLDVSFPFVQRTTDVNAMTGIRFWARSDQKRTFRFDLSSAADTAGNLGVRKGWDPQVGPEPTEISVRFSQADAPGWSKLQGKDPQDPLDDVLRSVSGIHFNPMCVGRSSDGLLGDRIADVGFLEIDAIEFFTE